MELHTIKTKQGNTEVEITMSKKIDLDFHALWISISDIGRQMAKQTQYQKFSCPAPSNEYQTSSNLITLTPGAAPDVVESIANEQGSCSKIVELLWNCFLSNFE